MKASVAGQKTMQTRPGLKNRLWRDRYLLLMTVLPVAYFVIFCYAPMGGLLMAFQKYSPGKGLWGSKFVGLQHFKDFFNSFYCGRIISNTLVISFGELLFGFPLPIIFALMINECRSKWFPKIVQTVSYLPHFISTVIVCGIIYDLFSSDIGLMNKLVTALGGEKIPFLSLPEYFRPIYVGSSVWQSVGWGSIVYLAALSGIDQGMYEAARIDGATRWQQIVHITLPNLLPIIMMLLILRLGQVMSVGFEKVLLLYTPSTYETADVISTYVYRRGILNSEYSFGAAVGLFNSLVNCLLVVATNYISRLMTHNSLW